EYSSTWNKEVIYRLFDVEQARCILNIPLAGRGTSNMLVWQHDASGEYSVKSGYKSLLTDYKRNKLVNKGLNFELHEIVGFIQSYVQDSSLCKTKGLSPFMQRNVLWRPPKSGVIKLNFDASFMSNTNFSISAVLARDSDGQIMGACTYPLLDVADAFMAEARACERALYFALDMGFRKHILFLAGSFKEVTYPFVPREANKAAHELAMDGRNRQFPCFWVEEAPLSVIDVVESDRYEWFHRR
ncbi:hypothetical protein Goshw_030386, partial [Gossypium schwendimanii]|nr:hypothetical protein [Gossypium schwendimanii]